MTKGKPTNIAASAHARLMNLARAGGRSFNDLLQLYAMERFLYRLSQSPHASKFMLKGALLLRVWNPATYRTTRDIDLLGRLSNEVDAVAKVIQAVCLQKVDPDGLEFDAETVRGESIVEDGDYQGVRITFRGHLGNARADMQIDVGFGDEVTPSPSEIDYPVLLDNPAPRLTAYPPETTIAEKFEVMLKRGVANSRMKDFHDIWWLAQSRVFDGSVLAAAVKATCSRRGTPVVERPTALTRAFADDPSKTAQWRAFRGRLTPTNCPEDFEAVVDVITVFIQPVAAAIAAGRDFTKNGSRRDRGNDAPHSRQPRAVELRDQGETSNATALGDCYMKIEHIGLAGSANRARGSLLFHVARHNRHGGARRSAPFKTLRKCRENQRRSGDPDRDPNDCRAPTRSSFKLRLRSFKGRVLPTRPCSFTHLDSGKQRDSPPCVQTIAGPAPDTPGESP